jgi:hypothetical protein
VVHIHLLNIRSALPARRACFVSMLLARLAPCLIAPLTTVPANTLWASSSSLNARKFLIEWGEGASEAFSRNLKGKQINISILTFHITKTYESITEAARSADELLRGPAWASTCP